MSPEERDLRIECLRLATGAAIDPWLATKLAAGFYAFVTGTNAKPATVTDKITVALELEGDTDARIRRIVREEIEEDRVLHSGFVENDEERANWRRIVREENEKLERYRGC